jgi:hypothetical protein
MSIRQVGILIFFSILACPLDAPKRRSLANLATPAAKPTLILIAGGASRTASLRTTVKMKALRIIFAGRLGSTAAVTTLLTPKNRNVFIIPSWLKAWLVLSCILLQYGLMSTSQVGI